MSLALRPHEQLEDEASSKSDELLNSHDVQMVSAAVARSGQQEASKLATGLPKGVGRNDGEQCCLSDDILLLVIQRLPMDEIYRFSQVCDAIWYNFLSLY